MQNGKPKARHSSPSPRPTSHVRRPTSDDDCGAIGSLGCPGVDADAWQKANRAPVYTGKTNHWLLAAAVRPGANDKDLMSDLRVLFWTWFADASQIFIFGNTEFEAGNADNVRIVKATPTARRLENPAARREDLPGPIPAIVGSIHVVYVEVSFTYRGQLSDVPWPTFNQSAWTHAGKICPSGANWVLLDVGNPTDDAPAARTLAEKITSGTVATVRDVASGVATGLGFGGAFTIGLGIAIALWLSKK